MDFHTIFRSRCLITDGAMGTYYSEKYGKGSGSPENDNLTARRGSKRSIGNISRPERIS